MTDYVHQQRQHGRTQQRALVSQGVTEAEEFVLSGYGDVISIEPQADRDAYIIRNTDGKVWELTAEQLYAGRKGTPMVRYLVTWRRAKDGLHYFGHTSKPTALGHVRGLQRDPRVLAVAIYPVTGEEQ